MSGNGSRPDVAQAMSARLTPAVHDGAPRVVVGFDPGAAYVGWCSLAVDPAGARYLDSGTLEIEPSDPGLAALRLAGCNLLDTHGPAIVAVERIAAVYAGPRFSPKVATGLVLAAHVAGELAGLAAARGLEVRTITHNEAKIAIGAPAGDGRAVLAALRTRVTGWPQVIGDHERDAGAVALAALLADGGRHG